MKQTSYPLSIPLLLLVLLAACVAPAAAPATTDTAVTPTTAPAATSAFPVTITHDKGELTLDKPTERIIVFSEEFTELFVALDIAPVGVALWRNEPTGDIFNQLPYLDQPIPGEPRYIDGSEPNLEVIAALQPDLILNHEYSDSGNADLQASLAQIAPTLTYYGGEVGGWKRAIRGLGQATGHLDRAEAIIADYDTRVAELQAAMTPVVEQAPTVALLLSGVDFVGIFDERFAIGGLMQVLGFTLSVPEMIAVPKSGYVNISVENLREITTDTVVQMRFNADQEHISDPILASLPMPVLQTAIYQGMGYTGPFAETIYLEGFADALRAQYLVDAPSATVATAPTIEVLSESATERVIRHAAGRETTIPAAPQCIVTAGSGYLDHLLALGVKPCGAAHGPGGSGFPTHLADQLTGVDYVGGTLEVNLERVALLHPDLILAMHPAHTEGDFATLFDPIAPTIYLTEPWADWRQALKEIGLILGKTAEADAALAAFDGEVAAAKATLATAVGAEKVAFLRVLPEEIRVYGTASPTGALLFTQLGLTPAALVPMGEQAQSISLELIPDLDAEHIFLLDQTKDGMATLNNSPLWQTVPAVAKGHLYPVDVKIWVQGEGLLAYEQLVADVVAALANDE